jgi:16S rRNA (cytidine1402-2'-O)-methyltransferase
MSLGKLYLIPTTLGDNNPMDVLPSLNEKIINSINHFIVENEKTTRHFIKKINPEKKQSDLILNILNKRTTVEEIPAFLNPCFEGYSVGLISEAGCPGIADPGADVVALAHKKNIQVVPLVGPSSILLALMASGMNGQSFAFNGYLPIDKSEKKSAIKSFERLSFEKNQSQLFIETPYRNNKLLEDLLQILHGETSLCIACNITLADEMIKTYTVNQWKKNIPDLQNKPTIFIIHKKN